MKFISWPIGAPNASRKQLQDKRDRILQAVRAVVGEVGFRGAQVAMVAEAAGVATGTVYRHFPSKGELFAEALALNAQHEVDVMAAVAQSDGSAASRLADAVRVFARRAVRARRLAWAMIAEPAEPEVDAARLKYRRAFADVLRGADRGRHRRRRVPAAERRHRRRLPDGRADRGADRSAGAGSRRPPNTRALVDEITAFCLQAVSARP